MRLGALSAVVLAGSTSAFASTGSLPLKLGYFVRTDASCGEASNATLTLYNGIYFGQAHLECRRPVAEKRADGSYRIQLTCRDTEGLVGPWFKQATVYWISSELEFVQQDRYGRSTFRYCPQAELPDPYRQVDLSKLKIER